MEFAGTESEDHQHFRGVQRGRDAVKPDAGTIRNLEENLKNAGSAKPRQECLQKEETVHCAKCCQMLKLNKQLRTSP